MGLGKTIQVISYLTNHLDDKTLIVCPATLMENWFYEFKKFSPKITVRIAHNSQKKINKECNIIITSYQTLLNDPDLKSKTWNNIFIDEAQMIKNPSTKISKVCRELKSDFKLCLSGTPIENKIHDIWSLFEFSMAGFLGDYNQFIKQYHGQVKKLIEQGNEFDASGIQHQLKERISPFILRRKKTDKLILPDLPEKIEKIEHISLSKDQKRLYKKLVEQFEEDRLGISDLFREKQIILTLLIRLKQVCNHPCFIDKNDHRIKSRSGKVNMLEKLLERIISFDEKVLIFSQFKETCRLLHRYLTDHLEYKSLIIDGDVQISTRQGIVDEFQQKGDAKILILSLKAGGTGLNLTAANHVIHFDRWWNPAVENQATDRSFRIGQHKNVMVHKLVSLGTIEEKIDILINYKKELSDKIISTDENILTELSTDELLELIKPDFAEI